MLEYRRSLKSSNSGRSFDVDSDEQTNTATVGRIGRIIATDAVAAREFARAGVAASADGFRSRSSNAFAADHTDRSSDGIDRSTAVRGGVGGDGIRSGSTCPLRADAEFCGGQHTDGDPPESDGSGRIQSKPKPGHAFKFPRDGAGHGGCRRDGTPAFGHACGTGSRRCGGVCRSACRRRGGWADRPCACAFESRINHSADSAFHSP